MSEEAEEQKKKGNEAFKAQNWDEAIKCYNKAIALDPTNAAYYSNRSGAWSSKGNHESALSDASKCLNQDSKFIKGYARKGKALFDLGRWDEAEVAYKEGLQVDPANDGCKRGIADITSARQRRSSAGARSSGSGGGGFGAGLGGLGGMGGFLPKVMERFKKGGRMQMYMVVLVGYYLFSSFTGRFNKKTSQGDSSEAQDSVDYEDDEAAPVNVKALARQFTEVEGQWISYMQAGSRADTSLVLLHRSSLSAETEFGAIMLQLEAAAPRALQVLAPDRPCHGYSPCREGGEPANASTWLRGLLAARPKAKRLALAAAGREAAEHAFAFARRRPEVAQIWLLAPNVLVPDVSSMEGTAGMQSWLEQRQGSLTPREAADVMRWAALSGAPARSQQAPKDFNVPKLPKGCKVTILYNEKDKEDEQLIAALQASGLKPTVRNMGMGETVHAGLVEEVQQVMGDSESAEADD